MKLKDEFKELVRKIKSNSLAGGYKLRNEDMAKRLGYNPDYFSTLTGKSGTVNESHIKDLKDHFKNELDGIIKPSRPGNKNNRERAMVRVMWQRVAKQEAVRLGISVKEAIQGMEDDTMIAWSELEQED